MHSIFKPGDKVESLDSKATFVVIAVVTSSKLLVRDEFDMEYHIPSEGLLKKDGAGVTYVPKSVKEVKKMAEPSYQQKSPTKISYINTFKISGKSKAKVDLHLHEILPDNVRYEPSKALEFQMRVFEQSFERALAARVKEFMIVHGYGKGVLRSEIRTFLSGKGLEFMDADYGEYGQGATRCFMR
jgi:dsDNA-specific endonuclease/ATPase MutS2